MLSMKWAASRVNCPLALSNPGLSCYWIKMPLETAVLAGKESWTRLKS